MIWEQFLQRVEEQPDRPAVRWQGRAVSYAQLVGCAQALAGASFALDLEMPCRALVKQADSWSILVSQLACWRAGVTPVLMRESATDAQLQELKQMLRPVAVLTTPVAMDAPPFASPPAPRRAIRPREEGLVISTSGTTGAAKLVALPAESLCINAATIAANLGLTSDDRIAVINPLTYAYGLIGGTITGLLARATVHLFSPKLPLSIVQAGMRSERITVIQGAPSLMRLFLTYWNGKPFPDVRIVTTGGEYVTTDLAAQLDAAFPNARKSFLFGMTEAGPRISHDDFARGLYAQSCIGKPFSHIDWRIEPVDIPGAPANVGRLVLRGPTLFLGYLQPSGRYEGLDAEGFFHSNDLVSTDEAGLLYYHGRADRMFKTGGKLINPAAIERVLLRHPDVRDAHCYSKPHDILGFVPVADVVAKQGRQLDIGDLIKHCEANMETHAVPREIHLLTGLKLAESGKALRT